jgi:hypothetical protein
MVIPDGPGSQAFVILQPLVLTENCDGFGVDADDAGPAAFGRSFDALTLDDGG